MLHTEEGRVLKPIIKQVNGEREIMFYESLKNSDDSTTQELKKFVPDYFGIIDLQINRTNVKYISLKDLTEGITEPCVMDIKIGKRTWDPTATEKKKEEENLKYVKSKEVYGFCITGFQVYSVFTGELKKFDKDYGKKLDRETVVEALKMFLNINTNNPPCRQLIMKLLSALWKIQLFFRSQRKLRFYASSLLIVYDAAGLRHCMRNQQTATLKSKLLLKRSMSLNSQENNTRQSTRGLLRSDSYCSDTVEKLCCTHSLANNFDEDLARMKEEYGMLLRELNSSSINEENEAQNWVRVNMIDFAHVFPADELNALDINYLEGIENLIRILEQFLPNKCSIKSTDNNI
ncbi:inositol polyphosphate multikinase isoform X2 [Prorops nasuta]